MPIAGIIAEYNPFHRGHAYQLEELRHRLGKDTPVVAVMSGNYVQRGDCAMFSKHSRAGAAVACGVDLVLELPLTWATASAERFARGGVEVLAATGVVDTLVFGSESGDLTRLEEMAGAVDSEQFPQALRRWLGKGLSFAAARQKAVEELLGHPCDLSQPNDLLGVEYLRAMRGTELTSLAIQRKGAAHDQAGEGDITSASDIRRRILAGEAVSRFLPAGNWFAGESPASLTFNQRGVLTRLRQMGAEDFLRLPYCGDGLEMRMAQAAMKGSSLEEVYSLAKTRRFAHSRIRRLVLWSYLGLTEEDFLPHVPYLRVLAANGRGIELLHQMRSRASLPVVTKPAAVRQLDERCCRQMALEARGTDLWQLCRRELTCCAGGQEWLQSPLILKGGAE